ncbi:MAG: hypothetical protein ACO3NL_01375, partial [Phycisphaerales bacterium]
GSRHGEAECYRFPPAEPRDADRRFASRRRAATAFRGSRGRARRRDGEAARALGRVATTAT